jgi:LysM repeat protein
MDMKRVLIFTSLAVLFQASATENQETQMSRKAYLEQWRQTAVIQQREYHIPASITMAQAILESGSGNSELAKKANNHFGIKCHDWKGATIYMDDDAKGECFRVYASAEESFKYHSLFLTTKSRYAVLFQLPSNDYKAWARGLKDAGYATNPQYADLLINVIDELKLYELDETTITSLKPESLVASSGVFSPHQVSIHANKVRYIVARKGDTYVRIAKEFDMGLWQLYRYNDSGQKKDCLIEGDIVYLQPKRSRSHVHETFNVTNAVTLSQIAQKEAVNIKSLLKLNKDITSEFQLLKSGSKVILH